eukprot:SAG22_NODE_140_length_17982_cov_81.438741_9_plen_210_part_00
MIITALFCEHCGGSAPAQGTHKKGRARAGVSCGTNGARGCRRRQAQTPQRQARLTQQHFSLVPSFWLKPSSMPARRPVSPFSSLVSCFAPLPIRAGSTCFAGECRGVLCGRVGGVAEHGVCYSRRRHEDDSGPLIRIQTLSRRVHERACPDFTDILFFKIIFHRYIFFKLFFTDIHIIYITESDSDRVGRTATARSRRDNSFSTTDCFN